MASLFRTLILLSALILIALGGYLRFVSSQAPNFFLFGDLQNNSLLLFLMGGILIIIWIVVGLSGRNNQE
ncbi:hypothetical protein KJN74_06030 [Candidatus Bathyarchaeota archaeon]|nr:hypothetical protein [Candidatus Bathyarchaeota archaeon]